MKKAVINYVGKEKRLYRVINESYPDIGYGYFQQFLKKGDIKVNGKRVKTNDLVDNNSEIIFFYDDKKDFEFVPDIVYEDENLLVIDKPKHIKSEGTGSIAEKLNSYFAREFILCHRLDTNTEGLLIFAKNEKVFEEIKRCFREGFIKKFYQTIVIGCGPEDGTHKAYLIKDAAKGKVYIYDNPVKGSMAIVTSTKRIASDNELTLLEINLITGRTHQIRAHLAYMGYPVLGDGKYGDERKNRAYRQSSQMLVSYKIEFAIDNGFLSYLNKITLTSSYSLSINF